MAEEEEENSKFFLSLEKRNYTNKLISALEINGKIANNPNEISGIQTKFYQTLYSEENLNSFLINNKMPKLSDEEWELCEKPVCHNEIFKAIKDLSNSQTPGSDDLPADWYKFFWIELKNLLTDSIVPLMLYQMSTYQSNRRKASSLCCQRKKNRLYLKIWRSITLLNTYYKIIAKVLASRLKLVLPSIINNDQSGYLKGQYIGQNIRIFKDVTFFCNQKRLPGISLSIDFEKAFDSLNWKFLFKTLEHLNFGNIFIGYVKTMYTDNESTVFNNGNSGISFKLQRGVRQGCPLSAYLFITALKTLANNITNDKHMKGIKIDNNEIEISLLADDITLILSELDSVKETINVLKGFSLCAGLKINVEKTQAKYTRHTIPQRLLPSWTIMDNNTHRNTRYCNHREAG